METSTLRTRRRSASKPPGADLVGPALLVAGVVYALMSIIGVLLVLAHLVARPEPEQLSALEVFGLMAGAIGGLSIALALWVLAVVLSYARSLSGMLRRLADKLAAPAAESGSQALDEVLVLLRELRDNSLLSESQKQSKLARQASEQRRALMDGVRSFVAKGEFHRAISLVDEMERRFGTDYEVERVREDVRTARAQAEKADVEDATRKIEELISIAAWPRAEEIANELLDRHPDASTARQLASRVKRQRQQHIEQQRMTAYAEIQRHTSRREWKQALVAARSFLERFPQSIEAEALRVQIETLAANAEIEERHRIEDRIKQLVKEHRFTDALELAREIIRKYPQSPQAEALRSQLPRLEARAQSVEHPA